jgi:acetyltransferase-like isoleucine patch superfamily enzyme
MLQFKKITRLLFLFILPSPFLRGLNGILGIKVGSNGRIGFSLIYCEKLVLAESGRIGHFNFININNVALAKKSYIGHLNRFNGPFNLRLAITAGIGNFNTFVKAPLSVKNRVSSIYLGKLSKITSRHYVDCMCNITIFSYTTVAGIGSQLWTHGYYHFRDVHKRVRIDGEIKIGRYCYIGSGSIFNPGVNICSSVNLGCNSTISKSISEEGFYVNQQLRKIDKEPDFHTRLRKEEDHITTEDTYVKEL